MQFNSRIYDILKFIALVALPATASFYAGFGQLWEFPETDKVVTTIVLVDTFLGGLLQLSSSNYKRNPSNVDGYLGSNGVDPDTGIPDLQLTITTPPEELLTGKTATLKIGTPPS